MSEQSKSNLLAHAAKMVKSHPVKLVGIVSAAAGLHFLIEGFASELEADLLAQVANGTAMLIFVCESAVLGASVVWEAVKEIIFLARNYEGHKQLTEQQAQLAGEEFKQKILKLRREQATCELDIVELELKAIIRRAEIAQWKNAIADHRYPLMAMREQAGAIFGVRMPAKEDFSVFGI